EGVDTIAVGSGDLVLNAAQVAALDAIMLQSAGTVTLSDTGTNIARISAADLAGLEGAGLTAIYATNGTLTLSAAQYDALGAVAID
ncbi:hypothetical protein, partial [Salmonella enterica]|uniref:hypothetical protein n=1 Tax=Salmonella enterica TaxID=28901 RepID=UPI003D2E6E32